MPRRLLPPAVLTAVALVLTLSLLSFAQTGGAAAGPGGREMGRPAPLTLASAALTQSGSALELRFATGARWSPASLLRNRQTLCLRLVFVTTAVNSRDVCVRRAGTSATLTLARVLRSGGHGPLRALGARVSQPTPRSLSARFPPGKIGIAAGSSVRWRVLSSTDGCAVGGGGDCFRARPQELATLTLSAPRPSGCVPAGPAYVTNGSRGQKRIALTFDDGPGPLTPAFLDVLRRKGVRGTFFMIGRQVAPNAGLVRRMLAEGHELGNHTWSHVNVSGAGSLAAGQITAAATAIQAASGFKPCSFRAPGGMVGSSLTSLARGLGFTTVEWDVDPFDWRTPGTDAIYSRIVGSARSGSIVLMHDGGGPRAQTLAALPRVIDTLRARGYRFVTVSELLGATFT